MSSQEGAPTKNAAPIEKYVVIPYIRGAKGKGLVAAEIRPASSEVSAIRIATSMSERFVGVAAFAVTVDKETGDMLEPRLLVQKGDVPPMDQ